MLDNLITVSQLNRYIKAIIDENKVLNNVYVSGEISNFKNHFSSGHLYLTLKDESASVNAIIYKFNAQRIKFDLYDGLKVIVRGKVSLYEKSGQYQIIIDDIQPEGIGSLALASKEGLFDENRKKPIPAYPKRVGVVTSSSGAALQDIINIISRRFPLCEIILCPVEVQGLNAAPSIVDAVKRFNKGKYADVLIVGRGGGSAEDLWAFNEEAVARSIYESEIPVVSAVGHETDFTICDFVADLRAPTPSAAAELCVPDKNNELNELNSTLRSAENYINNLIYNEKLRIKSFSSTREMENPLEIINSRRIETDLLSESISNQFSSIHNAKSNELKILLEKLNSLNPVNTIMRGFAFVKNDNNAPVKSVKQIAKGDRLNLTFADGNIDCEVI